MPDLRFEVESINIARAADAPALLFHLRIDADAAVETILLRCQIRIDAPRRRYSPEEQKRLRDLFGEPEQWSQTLRPMLWSNASATVPAFTRSIVCPLSIPCGFNAGEAYCKYFNALEGGEVPLTLLFSGSVFYRLENGAPQVVPIPWDKEAEANLAVQKWRETRRGDSPKHLEQFPADREIERLTRAVLYEGYTLYPYRPSSIKNRQRWNFGVLYPRSWAEAQKGSDRWFFRAEILAQAREDAEIGITARFLHLASRHRDGKTWEDASERAVSQEHLRIGDLTARAFIRAFAFEPDESSGDRTQQRVDGEMEIGATPVTDGVFRITAHLRNTSTDGAAERSGVLLRSLASASAALKIRGGEFVSATDPMPELKRFADACRNDGVWPVLLGAEPARNAVLAAPIILPDYPQIAPESPGDLFDGTEIDEILTLRILTLTSDEKDEIRASDERARALLERAESLPAERLMRLHGRIGNEAFRKGDRVRLHPCRRADILDIAFEGKVAIVEAVERDFENNLHLAVVLEDDPGRDLGELRQAGHRFFFSPEEVERVA